jgi:hypothetical protein
VSHSCSFTLMFRCARIVQKYLSLPEASTSRAFSTSSVLHARNAKWGKKTQIRVKSKNALAAREVRKQQEAAQEFARAEKLKLVEAINVLRVRFSHTQHCQSYRLSAPAVSASYIPRRDVRDLCEDQNGQWHRCTKREV